ncbi:tripartite motif containing 101 isoform X2 [Clupea harengus]|uniref:RING-type E3 ubiquitin transferase n=1 Tax=Clupea harengus TaxID=7950 RepID=A0A6P3W6D5_CLUHA|nr:tripartite motif containing 101 isoform X2 [Clupea harengus]
MSLPLELGPYHRDQALNTLERQLICPICLEVFTKPVVILPCQHNLCRKCANELYQVGTGGRFRCPSCRHEVVLDRHGVYGLQRNLLVENIIDVYNQESACSRPLPIVPVQLTCEEHEGEKVNIYCISCKVPTCSLCKVFGAHKTCQVAPLAEVYQQQKAELNDGIVSVVARNDQVQAAISEIEEICQTVEENSKTQKQALCEKFERLSTILEERRKIMMQHITYEQDEKTNHTRSLVRTYGEHVDANTKLAETALHTMEEPEMAAFVQNAKILIERVNEAANAYVVEKLEPGYENMDHYKADFNAEERALSQLDFVKTEEEEEVPEEQEQEPETEPEPIPEPVEELEPEPEPEANLDPILDLPPEADDTEPVLELKPETWAIKDSEEEAREEVRGEAEGCSDPKMAELCIQEGISTQQAVTFFFYFLALMVILQRVWGHIQCIICT